MTSDKPKNLKMWKIEGKACSEISDMVETAAEQAQFLYKAMIDAKKRLNEHMEKENKRLWKRIREEVGLLDGHGMHLTVDTDASKVGIIIVKESERMHHGLVDLLSHLGLR